MIRLNVRYLRDEEIAEAVAKFRHQYGLYNLPIDIERLIEFDLDMEIIPIQGLEDWVHTTGFISNDFTSIYVDERVQMTQEYRYRFTLAHEVGHYVLHQEYFSQLEFSDFNEWKTVCTEIDNSDHSKLEYQGYMFGGMVLVPKKELKDQFEIILPQLEPLIEQAKSSRIARHHYLSYAIDAAAQMLSPVFQVSIDVLTRRINHESLYKLIP